MSKEKLVLAFVAILLGLFVAGGGFYIYQMTRTIEEPQKNEQTTLIKPTAVPENGNFLVVQDPKDEQVLNKRIINVSGKTSPDATIIISTESSDQVVEPSKNGDFSLTHTLEDGVNIVRITAVFGNGEEQSVIRTVTSTTEEF